MIFLQLGNPVLNIGRGVAFGRLVCDVGDGAQECGSHCGHLADQLLLPLSSHVETSMARIRQFPPEDYTIDARRNV